MPIESLHPQYREYLPLWQTCNDFYEGEKAVKDAGQMYLPKPLGQEDDEYRAYKERAMFFGGTARTVEGLVGAIMRTPPTVEVTKALEPWLEDVTGQGTTFEEFAKEVVQNNIQTGRGGILVDRTASDETDNGMYLCLYNELNITNWMTDETGRRLLWVVLREWVEAQDEKDLYKIEMKEQFRELYIDADGYYAVRLWQKKSKRKDAKFQVIRSYVPTRREERLDYIPFTFVSPHGIDSNIEKSPIQDLCAVNVSHYRTSADLEHGRHLVSLPTPWITGMDPEEVGGKVKLGSGSVWVFDNENVQVGMLEFSGAGLGHLAEALDQKTKLMAVLGARLLEPQRAGVEAAETARIHRQGDESVLSSIADASARALQDALRNAAYWEDEDIEKIKVEMNKDYVDVRLSAQDISALLQARVANEISQDTFLDNLKRGEVLPQARTIDEEKQLIQDSMALARPPTQDIDDEEEEEENE